VLGTDGSDVITLSLTADHMTVTTALGAQDFAGAFAGVAVYGFGGADVLRLANTVVAPSVVYAGDGNDTVFDAGQAAGSVYGGLGDDLMVAVGGGQDTVYGQDGVDSFWLDGSDTAADASSAETSSSAVHKISQFYQPYTTDSAVAGYVSLEIAGQNLLDPAAGYGYQSFAGKPLFTDGPDYRDIVQGYSADCYFMATLASLADTDGGLVRQMIAPLGDGTFVVQFYRSGQAYYVRLDADLPALGANSPAYARLGPDGELWAPLMEKAYAYFRRGQNSYASLDYGNMAAVYSDLTNRSTSQQSSAGAGASTVYNFVASALTAGHPVTAGSYSSAAGPIVGGHAYMIKSVQDTGTGQYVTVYNPWGYDGRSWDSNSGDGLLTLSIDQYLQYFSWTTVGLV
jgi:hypothetical protein